MLLAMAHELSPLNIRNTFKTRLSTCRTVKVADKVAQS